MVHGNPGDIFKILSTHKAELPTEIDVQENDLVCLIEATGAQSMVRNLSTNRKGKVSNFFLKKIYPRNTEFASVKHDHHSLACHLNPHLSESNLGFHDIHQITDTKMMRKRNVVTSKMIKIHSLKNSKKEDIKKAVIKDQLKLLATFAL
uniref:PK domain-containing protein n=1 Tax=Rhabditophanes sp. KR3021 TaxID=114890 RepID=A0AC35U5B6_9BILA